MEQPSLQWCLDNPYSLTPRYFSKHYPELYGILKELQPNKFSEKLYWYYHSLKDYPKCYCGRNTKFMNFVKGYNQYCSCKCAAAAPNTTVKRKQTCLDKYGTFVTEEMKKKRRQTTKERYGVEYCSQLSERKKIAAKILKDSQGKIKQTCLERYGVDNVFKLQNVQEQIRKTKQEKYGDINYCNREKYKQTCLKRYGADNVAKNESVKNKISQTLHERYGGMGMGGKLKDSIIKTTIDRYGGMGMASEELKEKARATIYSKYGYYHTNQYKAVVNNPELLYIDENGSWVCTCPHPECHVCKEKQYIINKSNQYHARIEQGTEPCTKLLPLCANISTQELYIRNRLKEMNIEFLSSDWSVLHTQQLDIYLPDYKLAIEVNGNYYHSLIKKAPEYHYEKWVRCLKQDVLLIMLWEDWIKEHPDVCVDIIKYHLGMIDNTPDTSILSPYNLIEFGLNPTKNIEPIIVQHGKFDCMGPGMYV